MYTLIYTPQARRDLNAIRKYITWRSGNANIGLEFTKKLRLKCKEFATIKGTIGAVRNDLGEGLRSQPFGNYIILFKYTNEAFEVISIIESHRDILALFEDYE